MDIQQTDLIKQIAFDCTKTFQLFNLSQTDALIFSYLYIRNEPYSVDDLSEELGQSKTSIHNSIRNLAKFNLIYKVWVKGSRKHFYQAYNDLHKHLQQVIQKSWIELIDNRITNLTTSLKGVSRGTDYELLQTKIEELLTFHMTLKASSETFFNKKPSQE